MIVRALSAAVCGLLLWLIAGGASAAIETFQFENEEQRLRYHQLVAELRCPKCQNQNLAGSDAPIAQDLRNQVHRMLVEGRSDAEIVEFMVSRYGDFVLYRPPFESATWALWLLPPALLLGGGLFVALLVRQQRRRGASDVELTPEERRLAASLLDEEARD